MKIYGFALPFLLILFLFLTVLPAPRIAFAHCDGLDGPVVKAARKALETGNVNLVLIWVKQNNEAEIRKAFENTLAVRKTGTEARELADLHFFETLVPIHRAGEGAPYTGLKSAGRDLGPAIPATDKAIENSSPQQLLKLLTDTVQHGVHERFNDVMVKKNYDKDNVDAGRAYVESYVGFIHYVERLYEAVARPSLGHYQEPKEGGSSAEAGEVHDAGC